MKIIFWFLFDSSPKHEAFKELYKLHCFMEGLKHQQKSRRKLPPYPFYEPYNPKANK